MSRLHNENPALRGGRKFAAALSDAGYTASRSLISRWESGEISTSYEAMTPYEQALGLESGRMSSLPGYIASSLPGVRSRVMGPTLDAGSREFAVRLDELIELAEDGEPLAREWQGSAGTCPACHWSICARTPGRASATGW